MKGADAAKGQTAARAWRRRSECWRREDGFGAIAELGLIEPALDLPLARVPDVGVCCRSLETPFACRPLIVSLHIKDAKKPKDFEFFCLF